MDTYYRAPAHTDPALTAKRLMHPGDTLQTIRGWHALPHAPGEDTDQSRRIGPACAVVKPTGDRVIVISPRTAR
jgi:hypothetical protein